ncbi:Flp pilus assembly protein TadG [Agromyces sp. 3263]|uniref:TadE/TadG family type IV pilus assembly protein n=1 Tax=Agromyces sp. 3263 TaxID=2817750 RepID=UPI00285E6A65|nr:TadE/TadG family type IV pilus assembly protein [Agromyces sp. 3263]MDR6905398.1 Flp pilus assembly protein TadG [Agromyces sp. 3263]
MHSTRNERGAAAVEFALIIPLLLLLVFGVMEFSRLYNEQISLSNAARSAARVMAIGNNQANAKNAAITAAPSLNPLLASGNVSISPGTCTPGATVNVTIDYTTSMLTGWFGPTFALQGKAATPCGG